MTHLARISGVAATVTALAVSGMAHAAEEVAGKPVPGGTGFQRAVTPVMRDVVWLDDFLLIIIALIVVFVLGLLAAAVYKFNAKTNPTPARFTHNALLEVFWTVVPIFILIIIAVPSLRLLFLQLEVPEPDLTIKATGYQWYWGYEYPDDDIAFDGIMLPRDELADNGYQPDEYLLATDTRVVVPVNKNVHMLITAADVIHSWALPSFGVKMDAVPGRINESWFRAEETGTFFGQCSELCGLNHSYMPIVVEVVTQDEYDAWVAEQTAKKAGVTEVAQILAD